MSRTEDYLDGLLNSVASGTAEEEMTGQSETADRKGSRTPEDDFLSDFEKDILGGEDADEFLRQFEMELDEEEAKPQADSPIDEDTFFENLGGIVNESGYGEAGGEASEDHAVVSEPSEDMDIMIDTLGELPMEEEQMPGSNLESGLFADTKEAAEKIPPAGEEGLMDLLQSEGEFSDIEEMLKSSSDNLQEEAVFDEFPDSLLDSMEVPEENETGSKKKKEKKREKKKKGTAAETEGSTPKTGFWQKLSLILFGPEEEEAADGQPVADPAVPLDIESFSDENLDIFQQADGSADGQAPEAVPEETAEAPDAQGGKKGRKDKKEKKPPKEKTPKLPKEPDLSPRLPKAPVFLVFVMSASLIVLIMVGTNLTGYTNSVKKAESAYVLGSYEEAYQSVAGVKAAEKDQDDFKKYRIMAGVEGEYGAYQSFMEMKVYDMALDSLIRTIGRCEKYREDAEKTGCLEAMEKIRSQAAGALGNFGITEEQALDLYAVENRSDYSGQLNDILAVAGLQR